MTAATRHWKGLALIALLGACDADQGSKDQRQGDAAPAAADAALQPDAPPDATPHDGSHPADAGDPPPDLPAPGEIRFYEPGGDTICSRGTPFRYLVKGGDPRRLVIDFQGGGACWNELTCSAAGAIFNEEAPDENTVRGALQAGVLGGLYDASDPDMPLREHTLVHIPYCTGDIHWGNAVTEYRAGLTIQHKGWINARAVLDWVYDHYPDVEEVVVTGCSAGAYGAILHSAYIAEQYRDARLAVIGDSGAGIITEQFFADSFPSWGAADQLPDWIPPLQRPITELTLADLYIAIANHYPQHRYAQYTTAFDENQIFYFQAMGGDPHEWPALMRARMATIRAGAENFRSYVPAGPVHCILPYHFFDTRAIGDVRWTDWMSDFIWADTLPADRACEGEECFDDPVCAACAADDSAMHCGFCRGWPDRYRQ